MGFFKNMPFCVPSKVSRLLQFCYYVAIETLCKRFNRQQQLRGISKSELCHNVDIETKFSHGRQKG